MISCLVTHLLRLLKLIAPFHFLSFVVKTIPKSSKKEKKTTKTNGESLSYFLCLIILLTDHCHSQKPTGVTAFRGQL